MYACAVVVLKVVPESELPPQTPGTRTYAYHMVLDEGIYMGYQVRKKGGQDGRGVGREVWQ